MGEEDAGRTGDSHGRGGMMLSIAFGFFMWFGFDFGVLLVQVNEEHVRKEYFVDLGAISIVLTLPSRIPVTPLS